ncbi:MAG: alpha-L-rhamnosidase [Candidatus Aldehydirespiratoraceae bacterium]|jgi:alpha-L-rhamnosidase
MELQHPSPFSPKWRGRWIWFERPAIHAETATRPVRSDPDGAVGLFRRVVEVDGVPAEAPCRLWVDGRYLLEVNGTEVARGPVRSDPRRAHYDVVDLAPALRPGTNVLSLTVRHFGAATSWWMPAHPTYTLGAGCVAFEAEIGEQWIVSDRSWLAAKGEAWTPVAMPGDVASLPLESFDDRQYPHGWSEGGFDTSEWSSAMEITPMHTGASGERRPSSDPFGMLRPPVRLHFPDGQTHTADMVAERTLSGAAPIHDPVAQVLADESTWGSDGSVVHRRYDLGRIAAGTVTLVIEGATAGTVVDLAASEHLDEEGRLAPLGQHAGLRYVCSAGDATFEGLDIIGTRFINASIRTPDGSAAPLVTVAIRDRLRPRPDGASFECSDPQLQNIFDIGLRTVDLSALDAYVDCPTREQRAWTGDSVVHQSVDFVTNPDWSMPRWHPELAAAARVDGMLAMAAASDFAEDDRFFVPDWSLHWVRSLHNVYRYTGDKKLVAELLPVAERTLRWFESYLADDHLLEWVDGWLLLDWSSVYSHGKSSILNGLWIRGLQDFAEMAEWLENHGSARWATERAEATRASFDLFWDDRRQLYVDHVVDGEQQAAASQAAGAAALVAEAVPPSRVDAVVSAITDRTRLIQHSWYMDTVTVEGQLSGAMYMAVGYPAPDWDTETQIVETEPFFRYVLHDALAMAGRADLIAELCRDWARFVDRGETSWPECWAGGTRCHGWSSTPTRDLIVHTLGITPNEPGYASVRVAPALGGLEWAKATVPTPHGFVTVEAYADGRVTVDSPVPVVQVANT